MSERLVTDRECEIRHNAVEKDIVMLQQDSKEKAKDYVETVQTISSVKQALDGVIDLIDFKIQTVQDEVKREQAFGLRAGSHPRTMWEGAKLAVITAIISSAVTAFVTLMIVRSI